MGTDNQPITVHVNNTRFQPFWRGVNHGVHHIVASKGYRLEHEIGPGGAGYSHLATDFPNFQSLMGSEHPFRHHRFYGCSLREAVRIGFERIPVYLPPTVVNHGDPVDSTAVTFVVLRIRVFPQVVVIFGKYCDCEIVWLVSWPFDPELNRCLPLFDLTLLQQASYWVAIKYIITPR